MSVGGKLGTYITGAQNMEAIIVSAILSSTSNGVGEDFSYNCVIHIALQYLLNKYFWVLTMQQHND